MRELNTCEKHREYTISEVGMMTRLTDRTIRNYIKLGLLEGRKDNGIWVFTKEQVAKMMETSYVKQAIQIKRDVMIESFLQGKCKSEPSQCTILDYPLQKESAQKLCNVAINYMNTRCPREVELSYEYQNTSGLARFIVKGPTQTVMEILEVIRLYAESL